MRVVIVGAGGHAQVVADILLRMHETSGDIQPIGYLDDDLQLLGQKFLDLPVLGKIAQLNQIDHDAVIVAIGDNAIRQRIFEMLGQNGERMATARHPRAVIAPDVQIEPGSMICAGVVVNTGSVVGANAILNTGCTVDHHCRIGSHAHIAPGAHLGGEVVVGNGALVGIGAIVMPRCHIGEYSVIGAGACVTQSVPPGLTVVGVPAKPIQRGGLKTLE